MVNGSDELCATDRGALLRLARVAIRDAVSREDGLPAALEKTTITRAMQTRRGVFVTLRRAGGSGAEQGELRGCIGNMSSELPLYRNLVQTAPRAALDDPRFPQLRPGEVCEIRIEVSALTELTDLERIEDLVLGTDGVQIELGGKRAVFLPQVALEQGWDRLRLMEQLAAKAGLSRQGWKQAELSVFRVEQFAESQAGPAAGG